MNLLDVQIIGAVIIGVTIGLQYWYSRRSEEIIRAWAQVNSYRLIEARNMFPFSGPFFWVRSGQQTVFHVTIRDDNGATKGAWLLCGNWWGRITSSDIKVRWEG